LSFLDSTSKYQHSAKKAKSKNKNIFKLLFCKNYSFYYFIKYSCQKYIEQTMLAGTIITPLLVYTS